MGRFKQIEADRWLAAAKLPPGYEKSWFAMAVVYLMFTIIIATVVISAALIILPGYRDQVPSPTGCSRLGVRDGSYLDDEHDEKHGRGNKDGEWKVKSLWIYPIKSCRGIELPAGTVVGTGLQYDRQFCFAQLKRPPPASAKADHRWEFITQRQFPLMSQVKTEVWVPDPKKPAYKADLPAVMTGGVVIVTFPHQQGGWTGLLERAAAWASGGVPEKSFVVPFQPTPDQIGRDYALEEMKIWQDAPKAYNMGIHVPPELRKYIGVQNPLTLFRVGKEREVYSSAPRKEQLGWQPVTGFADTYPLLLLGLSSIQDISNKQPTGSPRLGARRFRPNIIMSGTEAYAEDDWKRIRIAGYEYHLVSRCTRCKLPNVDPSTGVRHKAEPDRTLRALRAVDANSPKSGCLGMNIVPDVQRGSIKVGDTIEVLEKGGEGGGWGG